MANNKYQREIEEILENLERESPLPSGRTRSPSKARPSRSQPAGAPRRAFRLPFSAGHLFIASFGLLLSALLLGAGGKSWMVGFAVWGAIILFIVAYAMFFIQPRRYEKRWRGQVFDQPPSSGGSWADRMRRRFRR